MNDAIVKAANNHFSSNYFEARQKFREYVRDAVVGEAAVYPSRRGDLVGKNSQQMLRGSAIGALRKSGF